MATKKVSQRLLTEYVDTPAKVRRLVGLLPRDQRAFAKTLISANTTKKRAPTDQFANYQSRLAHSIVEVEEVQSSNRASPQQEDPTASFSISTQGSVQPYDPVLGHCVIAYFNYSAIVSGWFAGGLQLEPQKGGVTFTFLDGLPEGATLYFYLNWSAGKQRAVLSPTNVAVPRKILDGNTPLKGPDFQWTVVNPNEQVLVCINDNNPGVGTVAFGVDCRIWYYG